MKNVKNIKNLSDKDLLIKGEATKEELERIQLTVKYLKKRLKNKRAEERRVQQRLNTIVHWMKVRVRKLL